MLRETEESLTIVKMDSFTKERPRTNFYTGAIYTPPKTLQREKYIGQQFKLQNRTWRMADGPVSVEIEIEVNVPSSARKKEKEEIKAGLIYPTKKPDLDNVAKLVLDGLQGIAFNDDYQVVDLKVSKRYGEEKRLKIKVKRYEKI